MILAAGKACPFGTTAINSGLALGELGDDVVDALLKAIVAAGAVLEGEGREVVAEAAAGAGGGRFPAAIRRGLGGEAGLSAEVVQEAVGFEGEWER
jgi:hypothetical protein